MTIPWVCASCSRRLLYLSRRQSLPWQTPVASYITFEHASKPASADIKADKKEKTRKSFRYRDGKGAARAGEDPASESLRDTRPARPVPTLELLDSAEDEFLQRLLKSRDIKGRGPYSKLSAEPLDGDRALQPPTRLSYRPLRFAEGDQPILKPLPGQLFAPSRQPEASEHINPSQAQAFRHAEPLQHERSRNIETRNQAGTFRNDPVSPEQSIKRRDKISKHNIRPRQDRLEELFLSSARQRPEGGDSEPVPRNHIDSQFSTLPRGHWGKFPEVTGKDIPKKVEPFNLNLISDSVNAASLDTPPLSSLNAPPKESVSRRRRMLAKTQKLPEDVFMKSLNLSSANPDPSEQPTDASASDSLEESRQQRDGIPAVPRYDREIGRALEARDSVRVGQLWSEVQGHTDASTANSPALCSTFITAFMALQLPDKAIEVWNSMVRKGMSPGVECWDAMIKGHGLARDAHGVNAIWTRFLNSGIRPDAQIWSTRIHSLTISGHWQAGIAAFQEMASTWVNAIKKKAKKGEETDYKSLGDIDGIPKPNTNVLNGLVAGLARGKKHEHLTKVFGWARTLGIAMDSFTFNPILASAVRKGDGTSGLEVLERMKTVGVKPDIATYTLLLQLIFRSDQGVSEDPAQAIEGERGRQQAVADVLKMMFETGLDANAYTFATLVNGVLTSPYSSAEDSLAAAYMILDHMEAMKIPMSSQVYTNLLTHHFNMTPPDLAAIEALFSRARQDRRINLDAFFFDRLIEGFAKCGEIGKMTAALGQASKRNRVVSWRAMTEVVKALVCFGDRVRAGELAEIMRREDGSDDHRRSPTGRTTFWSTVETLGI